MNEEYRNFESLESIFDYLRGILSDRGNQYQPALDNFGCIAEVWNWYLRWRFVKRGLEVKLDEEDVAMLEDLMKTARFTFGHDNDGKRTFDTVIDKIGYLLCLIQLSAARIHREEADDHLDQLLDMTDQLVVPKTETEKAAYKQVIESLVPQKWEKQTEQTQAETYKEILEALDPLSRQQLDAQEWTPPTEEQQAAAWKKQLERSGPARARLLAGLPQDHPAQRLG